MRLKNVERKVWLIGVDVGLTGQRRAAPGGRHPCGHPYTAMAPGLSAFLLNPGRIFAATG